MNNYRIMYPTMAVFSYNNNTRAGVRATSDTRENYTPGWKYNHWELKGVPIRIELGPKDMEQASVVAKARYNGKKESILWSDLTARVPVLLSEIQAGMLAAATVKFDECKETVRFAVGMSSNNIRPLNYWDRSI